MTEIDWDKVLELCDSLAETYHKGQTRWNNDPYITHPRRIAESFANPTDTSVFDNENIYYDGGKYYNRIMLRCIALLHDVLEDCPVTVDELAKQGVPSEVLWPVIILTKLPGEDYLSYLLRLLATRNMYAILVKIHDIQDNLRDLHTYDNSRKQIDRYNMAMHIIKQGIQSYA